jgi:hypothetical protein
MSRVQPTVRYLIVCEDVATDPENPRRVTLVGLISAIRSLESSVPRFAFATVCSKPPACTGFSSGTIEMIAQQALLLR